MSNNIFFERGQMADKPNNYLWNGDCLELMKDIPDKSMDAIICDLPYGTTQNKWDSVIPFKLLWNEYERITKDNGVIVLFGSEPFSSALRMSNIKKYKYDWKWIKNRPTGHLNAKRMPMRANEDIMVFYKKQPTYNRQMVKRTDEELKQLSYKSVKTESYKGYGSHESKSPNRNDNLYKSPNNNLYFKTVHGTDKRKLKHGTQKPIELMDYLVKTYTNENDWVLDNTCGSNTTGIACYDLNRNYIGIEKDIDIYNVAKKRVEENILLRANNPKTLFDDKP